MADASETRRRGPRFDREGPWSFFRETMWSRTSPCTKRDQQLERFFVRSPPKDFWNTIRGMNGYRSRDACPECDKSKFRARGRSTFASSQEKCFLNRIKAWV